jgi:hypothetical protein
MALVVERVIRVAEVILGRRLTDEGRGVSVCLANVESRRLVETDGIRGVVRRLLAVVETRLGRWVGVVLVGGVGVFTLFTAVVIIGVIALIVLLSGFERP